MSEELRPVTALPGWVPETVRLYLDHTEDGISLRELARREGVHASTILRKVRKYETRRDDPLMDEALNSLTRRTPPSCPPDTAKDPSPMSAPLRHPALPDEDAMIRSEGRRILRRLAEPGAVLAIAADLDKAAVLREFPDGKSVRTAVVDRSVAQVFLLKDWISCRHQGRIATYELSPGGRAALRRMLEEAGEPVLGLAEAPMTFVQQVSGAAGQGDRPDDGGDDAQRRRPRSTLAESPVAVLGRRREKDGKLFLDSDLVDAAERLREDFELSQMGPRTPQNWEGFLTPGNRGSLHTDPAMPDGPRRARDRVAAALRDLGPGLGDVALRVCCYLEGVETAERRMGWSARSGKVVLRIALQRLRLHYDETYGRSGPMIG